MRDNPLIIAALGGSGTRLVARLARAGGVFMGQHLNTAEDSEPIQSLYNTWLRPYVAQGGKMNSTDEEKLNREFGTAVKKHLEGKNGATSPWGVKVPRTILMLGLWQQQFPRFKLVHVVRNGLDMAYSADRRQLRMVGDLVLSQAERSRDEPARALAYWCRVNTTAADFGERHMGSRYHRIRFEDLCDAPENVCRKLAAFIEDIDSARLLRAATDIITPPPTRGRWRRRSARDHEELVRIGVGTLERFSYAAE